MRNIIFSAIILLYAAANFYVAVRLFSVLNLMGLSISLPAYIAVFAVLAASVPVSLFGGKHGAGNAVFSLASVWMGILAYLLIFTLAADIIVLLLKLAGRASSKAKIAAEVSAVVLALITVAAGAFHAGRIRTARYTADSGKGAAPAKIVLVSDIHIGALGIENRLQKIADAISAEKPDIVCIAGDIFNNDFSSVRNPSAVQAALQSISAKYGVFACLGNHDCGNGFDDMLELISASGITLLSEDCAVVPGCCVICGRAEGSPIGRTGRMTRGSFESIPLPDDSLPVVVLDHNPARIDEYGENVSLVLCGHTHRGQLFPGSLITGAMYAVDYGMFKPAQTSPAVIVTSGVGYWGPPLRVGTDAEIAVIELR